jgi:hypothetical protein
MADQAQGFPFVDIKTDVVQGQELAAGGIETLAHLLNANNVLLHDVLLIFPS